MTPAKLTWRLPQPFGVKAVGSPAAFGVAFGPGGAAFCLSKNGLADVLAASIWGSVDIYIYIYYIGIEASRKIENHWILGDWC